MTDQTDNKATGNPLEASVTASTGGAATAAAAAAPGSDLERLLREYEEGTKTTTAAPAQDFSKLVKAIHSDFTPVREYVNVKAQEDLARRTQEDLQKATAEIKKVLPEGTPDEFAEGFLYRHVDKHSDALAAWNERDKAPDTWNAHVAKVRDAAAESFKKLPGNTIRTDIERAAAAVNNVSTSPPPPADLPSSYDVIHNMSRRDFEAYKRKAYAAQEAARKQKAGAA